MAQNAAGIVAIELLAAAQGIDFRAPLKTSPRLQEVHSLIRSRVGFYDHDRYFAPDITAIQALIEAGANVNLPDRGGKTPLALAQGRGYDAMAARLRQAGAR